MPAPTETIRLAVEAMRQDMAATEARITELQAELTAAREHRGQLSKGLYALDPQWAADNIGDHRRRPRTKGGGHQGAAHANPVGQETKRQVLEFIRAHFEPGEDITGPMIHEAPDSPASHSVVTRALRDLRDDGVLRLDRMGDGVSNRTKVFRLTQGGDDE